jgi:hypothetical protein
MGVFSVAFPTVLAAVFWVLWNKVRRGAENSRIAERIISRSNNPNGLLLGMVSCFGFVAIASWVDLGLDLAASPQGEVGADATAAVFFTVAAIGLSVYWKRNKRKSE